MDKKIHGVVAKFINGKQAVINKGERDGVKNGQKYKLYYLSKQDIVDPQTDESLGKLELLVGYGTVITIQEKMAIVESSNVVTREQNNALTAAFTPKTYTERLPFSIASEESDDDDDWLDTDTSAIYVVSED